MKRNYCFPKVLKKLMKERKTNMRRLADATGIGESTISDWIHRDISPSAVSLMTLSDYFNVSIDYLLFGEEFKK